MKNGLFMVCVLLVTSSGFAQVMGGGGSGEIGFQNTLEQKRALLNKNTYYPYPGECIYELPTKEDIKCTNKGTFIGWNAESATECDFEMKVLTANGHIEPYIMGARYWNYWDPSVLPLGPLQGAIGQLKYYPTKRKAEVLIDSLSQFKCSSDRQPVSREKEVFNGQFQKGQRVIGITKGWITDQEASPRLIFAGEGNGQAIVLPTKGIFNSQNVNIENLALSEPNACTHDDLCVGDRVRYLGHEKDDGERDRNLDEFVTAVFANGDVIIAPIGVNDSLPHRATHDRVIKY